jgi:co-chaperonin GroES (HSP10)
VGERAQSNDLRLIALTSNRQLAVKVESEDLLVMREEDVMAVIESK